MNVSDAIEQRRAVKHYDPNHRMSEAEVNRLLDLARLSPTSFNIQNWRFVVVRDPELRRQLRAVAWNQAQVTDASLLIVLCANVASWKKDPARYWRNAPKEVQDFLVPAITQFYEGREWMARDEAMRSVGMAAQTVMLAAKEMGLDSCPMVGFDFDAVAKLINLPKDHAIGMMIAVGKRTKDAWPRGGDIPRDEAIVIDRFA